MQVAPQEAPKDNDFEVVAMPPINSIDGDTIVTNHLLVSEPTVPMRRSERSVAQPTKYMHAQVVRKKVSFLDEAIKRMSNNAMQFYVMKQ